MLEFFVGAWDWFKIPIPIYTIVEGFVATARFRVQFVQNPPFVRNLTVTLMGVPKVCGANCVESKDLTNEFEGRGQCGAVHKEASERP